MSAPSRARPEPASRANRRLLVALDIDGTIVDHSGELSPAVDSAVRAVAAASHHVVVATGRSIIATTPILAALGLTEGYAVCSNGAVTLELDPAEPAGFRVVDTVTFDPVPALTVLREQLPDALVAVEDLGVGFKVSAPFPDGELGGQQTVVSWEHLLLTPATRVTIKMPDIEPDDFLSRVEGIGLHEVSYAVGWTAWLDLNPEGVSKGSALELLRRQLGVEPSATVAVGDQRNDVAMLQWAARGVAMGNAPPEVQAVASEVTATVEDDGLASVLRSLL